MAEIREVVSEQLQATIRRLLPSQRGFTEDLQASNVITPIIDLTPTAEGSLLDTSLQQALAFGSQTAFNVINANTTIINTAGFYRIIGTLTHYDGNNSAQSMFITMSDGLSTKNVWGFRSIGATGSTTFLNIPFDIIVFVDSAESVAINASQFCVAVGSTRQLADINGVLTDPSGFTSQ